MRDYSLYLKDILAATHSIEEFVAGMRDRLIHFYFGVNHRLIWKTIKEDLPKVRAQIEDMLERGG
jgi:uncharacterized protein with HEPN domain